MKVKLITITPKAEEHVVYCARVSSPQNQENMDTADRLLKYLIKHQHNSPFEQSSMTVEITTSRAISAQILRHRSFTFQEHSQRYSDVVSLEPVELRKQATHNRQSSTEILDQNLVDLQPLLQECMNTYKALIQAGVARECARMVLPLCTTTTLYMTGNLRSWMHYISLRSTEDTQKEHREIALAIRSIFIEQCPLISKALGWETNISGQFSSSGGC